MFRRRLPGVIIAAAALVVACTPSAAKPAWTLSPGTGGGGAAASGTPGTAGPTGEPGSGEILGTIKLEAIDIAYKQTMVEVDKAGRYTVELTNNGTVTHDVTFDGIGTATAQPGETRPTIEERRRAVAWRIEPVLEGSELSLALRVSF